MLTGHKCFNYYLHHCGKADTDKCALCGISPDNAEHAIINCDSSFHWLRNECVYLGVDELTPENIVQIMTSSPESWNRVSGLIIQIMSLREKDECLREQLRLQQ